jgi:predicted helicase
LADLHLNYETVEKYPLQIDAGKISLNDGDYRVEKMRPGKNGKGQGPHDADLQRQDHAEGHPT